MGDIWSAVKRAFRAGVALAVPLAIQYVNNSTDPVILGLAPVLMAMGKILRDKYGLKFIPV